MRNIHIPEVRVAYDASGASRAAKRGDIVIIVDVIDMSTTLETCIELGALAVFGASPKGSKAPVKLDPLKIAKTAAKKALIANTPLVIVSEPRIGKDKDRERYCSHILGILREEGCIVDSIIPNIGKEIAGLISCKNKIVIAVTDSGGTAYDAAFCEGAKVCTATIARTSQSKGIEPAKKGTLRALRLSRKYKKNITVVAASSNSMEDILAAQYISNLLLLLRKNEMESEEPSWLL
ncbi:MAG: hypothetical protein PWQ96_322 [Clostridia bacterium]|jgi:hypothetical protein|nr:hypothetical protein [Clostridia bacterium]